jgi:tetratricopeptide (TPR) repeat protein
VAEVTALVTPVLALLLQAAAADPAAEALAAARAQIAQGKPQAAIDALKTLDPAADARVGHLLGVAHYHANQPARAIALLTAAVDRLPPGSIEKVEATQVLGLALYLSGRIADALPYLERTREAAPDNPELAYVLGMAYIQTRQLEKARQAWARTFAVDPASASAHLLTAQMMIRAQLDDLAEAELRLAQKQDPRLPHVHYLLGQTALFRGQLDDSIALFKKELEINPADSMALLRLGDAYVRQMKWSEAISVLQRSVWINPSFSGPYILLGRAYVKKGELGTAEGMLRRAVELDPNNTSAHYLLAQVLQQTGRAEEAKREFEAAERLAGGAAR